MPIEGLSDENDSLRTEIKENYHTVQIMDSSYYGVDTFTLCEVNPYVLITQEVYADIHPNFGYNPAQHAIHHALWTDLCE